MRASSLFLYHPQMSRRRQLVPVNGSAASYGHEEIQESAFHEPSQSVSDAAKTAILADEPMSQATVEASMSDVDEETKSGDEYDMDLEHSCWLDHFEYALGFRPPDAPNPEQRRRVQEMFLDNIKPPPRDYASKTVLKKRKASSEVFHPLVRSNATVQFDLPNASDGKSRPI